MTDQEATPPIRLRTMLAEMRAHPERAHSVGRWEQIESGLARVVNDYARLLEVERAAKLYVQSIEVHADGDSRRSAYQTLRRLVEGDKS